MSQRAYSSVSGREFEGHEVNTMYRPTTHLASWLHGDKKRRVKEGRKGMMKEGSSRSGLGK